MWLFLFNFAHGMCNSSVLIPRCFMYCYTQLLWNVNMISDDLYLPHTVETTDFSPGSGLKPKSTMGGKMYTYNVSEDLAAMNLSDAFNG